MDPVELRRRNLIRDDAYPYTSPPGMRFEGLSHHASLNKLLDMLPLDRIRADQAEARQRGIYRGIGFASFIELTRSPTHKPHPNSGCCEFDEREVVGVVLFVSRGDGTEVFELVEEAFAEIAVSIEEAAERRDVLAVGHGFDTGPGAAIGQGGAHGVAAIGAVTEKDIALAKTIEHIVGRAAIMSLPFG
jgi:CO/xanthine dehydrogenase Mo-binding subunit